MLSPFITVDPLVSNESKVTTWLKAKDLVTGPKVTAPSLLSAAVSIALQDTVQYLLLAVPAAISGVDKPHPEGRPVNTPLTKRNTALLLEGAEGADWVPV